ncbi:MAG: quinolinate synthase NadA [Clostridiales bacterium]|nr:quinolinate synthase NadA [Clostridiales bacterium]
MEILLDKIKRLKEEKDAIILAHFYVNDEVQAIADYVGDSYDLSKRASATDKKVIVFCGVKFMGESAKIMNPEKTVLMPDKDADCPMAHMIEISEIEEMKRKYGDDLAVACYINSTAEIKAHADICVTSSNALSIIRALPQHYIFFIPDQNLGRYIASQLPEKQFLFHNGYCPIHKKATPEEIQTAKQNHPHALVLVHPECTPEVVALADYAGSTSGIINFATSSDAKEFIIGTETGVFYQLQKKNPGKAFYSVGRDFICPDMKRITLEKIANALENCENEVILDEALQHHALNALTRMHEIAK